LLGACLRPLPCPLISTRIALVRDDTAARFCMLLLVLCHVLLPSVLLRRGSDPGSRRQWAARGRSNRPPDSRAPSERRLLQRRMQQHLRSWREEPPPGGGDSGEGLLRRRRSRRPPTPRPTVDVWTCTAADGREWAALGVNRSTLCGWLEHELGTPAEELTQRCRLEVCALHERRTHHRLRRLWRSSRLLAHGISLGGLAEQGVAVDPERAFARQVGALSKRVHRLAPARHEIPGLLRYLARHSALSLDELKPQPGRPANETAAALKPLLQWFARHFPYEHGHCHSCGAEATFVGAVRPSWRERQFDASRAEVWHCDACGHWQRFPRFNDVSKILQTRQGRCGEYATAMLQFALALGWQARWVVDWTDHLWVEVLLEEADADLEADRGGTSPYKPSKERTCCPRASPAATRSSPWLHLDPCEGAVDEPHLYSSWGKNLTYIIAFGGGGIVDVTRTYAADWNATLARRELSEQQVKRSIAKVQRVGPRLRF